MVSTLELLDSYRKKIEQMQQEIDQLIRERDEARQEAASLLRELDQEAG